MSKAEIATDNVVPPREHAARRRLQALAFGDYRSTELIFEGATTVVYRAQHSVDAESVIIKTTRSEFPGKVELAKLRHEHAVLRGLQGPGIVPVRELAVAGRRLALVLADVGDMSLDQLEPTARDLPLILRAAIDVTQVLCRAHQRRIVHKDIKPHNILLAKDPQRAYLIDWGSSAHTARKDAYEEELILPDEGTLAYLAPEQAGIIDGVIDGRADLYSLGVTLYELLTGMLPFNDADPRMLLLSHQTRMPAPPREVNPEIPEQLAAIVMRLLAKSADDRYSTAYGLQVDLAECLDRWQRHGAITSFPLCRSDKSGELRSPQKLYGREADVEALISAYRRASAGSTEFVLVTGFSGVGKSSVVSAARSALRLQGARFSVGKAEQFQAGVPYAPWIQVLRGLLRQILTEPADKLAAWTDALQRELSAHANVLSRFIPELDRLLGPLPPVVECSPAEAENRLRLAVQGLISVFASSEHPVVLFIDDLQWAELASLNLLEQLLSRSDQRHLVVIGAYRNHDPAAIELLTRKIDDVASAGASITRVDLQPLVPSDVNQFVADALGIAIARAEPLAHEIFRKTEGNPFFVSQLLSTLVQDGLITFDVVSGDWRWEIEAIAARDIADGVAAFVAGKLRRCSPEAQALLKIAGCHGGQFDHDMLTRLSRESVAVTARKLWEAIADGFIVPLHQDYRLLQNVDDGLTGAEAGDASSIHVVYRFVHDRVQEAARDLSSAEERAHLNLSIALLYHDRHHGIVPDDRVFSVADYWNAAQRVVTEDGERLTAAELNLRAGRLAMASVAYDAAGSYLAAGREYLPATAWETSYDLTFDLMSESAATMLIRGKTDDGNQIYDELFARSRSPVQRASVLLGRMRILSASFVRTSASEVVRLGRQSLALLGIPLPEGEAACEMATEEALRIVMRWLDEGTVERLLARPPLSDPRLHAAVEALVILDGAAMAESATLSGLISLQQVIISLEHGPSEFAANAFATCALLFLRKHGKSRHGEILMRLAKRADEKWPNPKQAATLNYMYASYAFTVGPFREASHYFEQGVNLAWQAGSHWGLILCGVGWMASLFCSDASLGGLASSLDAMIKLGQRARAGTLVEICQLLRQVTSRLIGELPGPAAPADDGFSDQKYLYGLPSGELMTSYYVASKLATTCIFDEHAAAVPLLDKAGALHNQLIRPLKVQASFYASLHLCALMDGATGADRDRLQSMLDYHRVVVGERRALCEEAWRSADTLLAAEVARVGGETESAELLYEDAIELAQADGFTRVVALGNELYGRYLLKRRRAKLARACLRDAHDAWRRWGADAKAAELRERYDMHIRTDGASSTHEKPTTGGRSTVALRNVLFDLNDVMQAVNAISSEMTADHVIEQFVRLCATKLAARRTVIVLNQEAELVIVGEITASPAAFDTTQTPLASRNDLAVSVIRYVALGNDPVVSLNGHGLEAFAEDPYLREHRPRSLFCFPVTHQERLIGAWYAESDLIGVRDGVIELMQLLASHAANALANAWLYNKLQEASKTLARSNEELELVVAERTAELRHETEQLRVMQARVVKLEKQATEARMAGGFAHEMRNALGAAALLLTSILEAPPRRAASLPDSILSTLDELLALIEAKMPREDAARASELIDAARFDQTYVVSALTGIEKAIKKALRVTSLVLEFSQLGAAVRGGSPVDLGLVVQEVIDELRSSITESRVSVSLDITTGCILVGSVAHFRSIINNLVTNARDAVIPVQDRQRLVRLIIAKETTGADVGIMIMVVDNGVGIAPALRERIFEPFYSTKPNTGTGLGLGFVDRLVSLYGGTLTIKSAVDQGTTVTVRLPVVNTSLQPGRHPTRSRLAD